MSVFYLSKQYDRKQSQVIDDGINVLSEVVHTKSYRRILLVSEYPKLQIVKARDQLKNVDYLDISDFNFDHLFCLNEEDVLEFKYDCVFILGCKCKVSTLNIGRLFSNKDYIDFYLSLYETPLEEDIRSL